MAEEKENQNQGQEGQGQNADKITKQFNANIKKLVALMNGESNLKRVNVPAGEVGKIVEELVGERRKEKIEEFKKKAKEILDKYIEFQKAVKKEETEFTNKVNGKKKEFNEELVKLFAFVDDIAAVERGYYQAIGGLGATGTTAEPTSETPEVKE